MACVLRKLARNLGKKALRLRKRKALYARFRDLRFQRPDVIPGRPEGELWCALAHLRISRRNL
jgi:hypothetical protein